MKTIKVIPNPYCAVDADGVPQGVVGLPGVRGAWIGAAIDVVASRETGKSRFYFPAGNAKRSEETIAKMRVVTLNVADANVRATIANAILDGSLIVVSKDEAAKVGIVKEFLAPADALEVERKRALEAFRAIKGPKAELAEIPHEAKPEPVSADEDEAAATPTEGERLTKNVTLHTSTEA